MSSGTDLEETIQDSDSRPLHETGSCLRIPPPAISEEKRINPYTRSLLTGIGMVGLYFTFQMGLNIITTSHLRDIEITKGKGSAVEYAKRLWKEIHPMQGTETFTQEIFNSGKKSAVLEYLGYMKLDGE